MRKSELRKLVSEYNLLESKPTKSKDKRTIEKISELRHRYFHETGTDIDQLQ